MSHLSLAEMMKDFLISELCFERGVPPAHGPWIDKRTLLERQQAVLNLLELNKSELPSFDELQRNFKDYLAARDRLRQGTVLPSKLTQTLRRLAHSRIHQIDRMEHFIARTAGEMERRYALPTTA